MCEKLILKDVMTIYIGDYQDSAINKTVSSNVNVRTFFYFRNK